MGGEIAAVSCALDWEVPISGRHTMRFYQIKIFLLLAFFIGCVVIVFLRNKIVNL
jgi:hypothetical protein